MTTRLSQVYHAWLEQLEDWRELAPRAGGVSAQLATRRLLAPLYRNAFPETLARERDERRLRAWLVEYEEQILDDLRLVRKVTDRAGNKARELRASVTAGDLADRLLRAVAKGRLDEQPLTEMELEAVASTYVANSPSRDRLLSREQFGQFQDLYDESWADQGEAHLEAHPYSRVLLGADERPPLLRTQRENTWEALSRSIYSRFRIAARDVSVPGEGDDIARAEVLRACGRLGLIEDSALVLLYSLLCGLQQGPTSLTQRGQHPFLDEDRSWRQAQGPLSGDYDTESWRGLPVNQNLVAMAEAMIRTFCHQNQGRYLLANDMMDYAHQHAMRRAWMDCFKHDRRSRPIGAAEGAKIVTLAVFKGIPSGEEHRKRESHLKLPNLTRKAAPKPPPPALAPDVLNRAWAWFSKHREVVTGLVNGDPESLEKYRQAADELQLPELDLILKLIPKEES